MWEQCHLATWHPELQPKHKGSLKLWGFHFLQKSTYMRSKYQHLWTYTEHTVTHIKLHWTYKNVDMTQQKSQKSRTKILTEYYIDTVMVNNRDNQSKKKENKGKDYLNTHIKHNIYSYHPYQKVRSCVLQEQRAYKRG